MMKPVLTALCVTMVASPALALSCQTPDAAASFQKAAVSTDNYVILTGKLGFETAPVEPDGKTVKQSTTQGTFQGLLLTGDGFTDPVSADITVELSCLGEWCAKIKPDTTYLAFVQNSENKLTLKLDPCYWSAFERPTQDIIDAVTSCAQGGPCAPS